MKTAIVTGAAGFLGSHLSEKLIQEGYFVIGMDNFSTGSTVNIQSLQSRFTKDQFHFHEFDVVQNWQEVIPKTLANLQYVFHFASPASPPLYQKLSVETIWVNTIGLENAIKVADQHKAKVIFASTSEVYGDPSHSPQAETYYGNVNSFGPRSCYDEAKRCGEAVIYSYNQRNQTRHGMVRIFNTYGPRMNPFDGRVVINFLVQAMMGQALSVYGNGKQTRSFCYVDDLIEAIYRYAKTDLAEPVNIGNPSEFTVMQLAEKIQKMFAEKDLTISFSPLPGDDPLQRRPDISKAKKLLNGWEPKVPLDSGLQFMAKWLKENQEILNPQTKGKSL